jgi:hypothetical protein
LSSNVHRLLQPSLLAADDGVRCILRDTPTQAVVVLDDATVEVMQIGVRETAAALSPARLCLKILRGKG